MKKNKILIFGGHGQLAKCIDHLIKNHYLDGYDFIFLSHGDCDISKYPRVRDTINKYNIIDPDTKVAAVINCAAYNNVDLAETIGYEDNIMTNVVGVNNLALVCHEFNIPICYFFESRVKWP